MNLTFPATPARLYAMFQDETYLQMKCAQSENGSFTVARTSDLTEVEVNRSFSDIPESFKKFVGSTLEISESQHWRDEGADKFGATVEIVVRDKPVQIVGTFKLAPHLNGSILEIDAQVEVKIPLFGAMAEGVIKAHIQELLDDERAIALQWIENQS